MNGLKKNEANERFKIINSNIDYKLYLNLKKIKGYDGLCVITFNLKKKENTFLDFYIKKKNWKNIQKLEINKKKIQIQEIKNYINNGKILLLSNLLNLGENIILIKFENYYAKNGYGIHRSENNGNVYIHCQNEAFYINRIFPVFDQPDLKGKISYYFSCPLNWKIICNEKILKIAKIEKIFKNLKNDLFSQIVFENFGFLEKKKFYIFSQTKLISSYLFAFAAGNFECVQPDNLSENQYPMKIYCEKEKLEAAEKNKNSIFFFCQKSIKYFEKFFQIKSPFEKYDLVFCPDFICNAMEYPGVITFNSYFLYEEKISDLTKIRRAKTIVHEISHMWFGNLITMKWWDDLWLNESFADFVTFFCLDEMMKDNNINFNIEENNIKNYKNDFNNINSKPEFIFGNNNKILNTISNKKNGEKDLFYKNNLKNNIINQKNTFNIKKSGFNNIDIWTEFFLKKKHAYLMDTNSFSHPVFQQIKTTDEVSDLFDPITYAKGAAILKQLYFLIGKEKFHQNIYNYFNKYKWKNVEFCDFIKEISFNIKFKKNSFLDINFFCQEFLKKSGVNKIEVKWDINKKGKQIIKIFQTSFVKKLSTLRFHKIKFAFFYHNLKYDIKEILVKNEKITYVEINNIDYKAILPNFEDWGYLKIKFDNLSLDFFFENLYKMKNNLNIIIILNTIFDMVCNKEIDFKNFLQFLINKNLYISFKNNLQIFQEILRMYDKIVDRFCHRREKKMYLNLMEDIRKDLLPIINDEFVYKFFEGYYFEFLDS